MGRAIPQVSVLLVEDEPLISMLIAEWLVEEGFAVHEASTADEAFDYILRGGAVDVLFTDINLPGRLNGVELAERVRELRPELPVVYASGRYAGGNIGAMVPRSLFVPKPYDPAAVCKLLSRLTAAL